MNDLNVTVKKRIENERVKMSDTETLLPVYHKTGNRLLKMLKKTKLCSVQIPFPQVGWTTIGLSLFSFFFCVLWSIFYNFEEANATHCSVENFLPSISAAIGHFYPQIYVWNTSVLLQMFPRLKISSMYLHYYASVIYDRYSNLYHVAWALHVCELWSLLGLSLVTSTANYSFHALCFTCFLFSSMIHMILACFLLNFKRKIPAENLECRTLEWKVKCCAVNIFCFLMAGYFFRRHNTYCEPKVYSIFAFFEYGVVLSNIFFHQSAVWDFRDKTLTVALTSTGVDVTWDPPFKAAQHTLK